jgi:hypothetical protein
MTNANDWLRLRELAADRSRPKSGKYAADEREDPHTKPSDTQQSLR